MNETMALGIEADTVSVYRNEEPIARAAVSLEKIRHLLKRPGSILLMSPLELRSLRGSVEVRMNGRAFGSVSSVDLSRAAFPTF